MRRTAGLDSHCGAVIDRNDAGFLIVYARAMETVHSNPSQRQEQSCSPGVLG